MIEMCELDRIFGKPTDEEWKTYYEVRRIRTSWDVAGYLGWNIEAHFMSWKEAEKYEYEGDGPEYVTESEFLFICEYVETFFNTEAQIWCLIDRAHEIMLQVRRLDFTDVDIEIRPIVERTILLDRFGKGGNK